MKNDKPLLDLKIRCYRFSISIIKYIDTLEMKRTFNSLLDQLFRSSTSIGANIIEAKSASSKRDFIKFYDIALKSANETKYWLCLLRDGFELDKKAIENLLKEVNEISKIIAASLLKLKNKT
jgi:four helix bundle protein